MFWIKKKKKIADENITHSMSQSSLCHHNSCSGAFHGSFWYQTNTHEHLEHDLQPVLFLGFVEIEWLYVIIIKTWL